MLFGRGCAADAAKPYPSLRVILAEKGILGVLWKRVLSRIQENYVFVYYAALTRVSSLPPRRRHGSGIGLILRDRTSRRPRKGPVTTTYCHVDAVFDTS